MAAVLLISSDSAGTAPVTALLWAFSSCTGNRDSGIVQSPCCSGLWERVSEVFPWLCAQGAPGQQSCAGQRG